MKKPRIYLKCSKSSLCELNKSLGNTTEINNRDSQCGSLVVMVNSQTQLVIIKALFLFFVLFVSKVKEMNYDKTLSFSRRSLSKYTFRIYKALYRTHKECVKDNVLFVPKCSTHGHWKMEFENCSVLTPSVYCVCDEQV